jgi:hypothetical protein
MRLAAQEIQMRLEYDNISIDDLPIYSASAWLSDSPRNIKGQKDCTWPIKAMTKLLTELPDL